MNCEGCGLHGYCVDENEKKDKKYEFCIRFVKNLKLLNKEK